MSGIHIPSAPEFRGIDELSAYSRNPRSHPHEQIQQIVASMREWGWTIPILIDENDVIIAGHGRFLAAKVLGLEQVPVIVASGWSDVQKRAYVIADNQLTLNSDWDKGKLASELRSLTENKFEVSLTGFAQSFIDQLLAIKVPTDIADGKIMSPLDNGEAMLEWRDKMVPMTAEETKGLDKALKSYIHRTRSRSWFIDNLLKGTV